MKKINKKITIGILILLFVVITIIITINLFKNIDKEKEKVPFDQIYWEMKKQYEDEIRTVDIINNVNYYTANIYNRENGILLGTIEIDAYTGKRKNKGVIKENTAVFYKENE